MSTLNLFLKTKFRFIAVGFTWAALAVDLHAEPPVDINLLPEVPLTVHGGKWSSDGEMIEPKKICSISPGERNSVLKQGALLSLRQDKSVAGLDLFAAPLESSLRAAVFHRVYLEDGVLLDIGELTHLEYLDLLGVDLTRGAGLKCLGKLENLRVLRLVDCHVEVKDILAHLPACPRLEILKVSNDKFQWPDDSRRFKKRQVISVMEVARLTANSPKLRQLFLKSTERYEPEAIAQFAKLAELDCMHIRTVGNMPAASLKTIPQQHTAAEELEKLLAQHGLKRWRHSGQRWDKSYTLPHTSVYVPQLDEKQLPVAHATDARGEPKQDAAQQQPKPDLHLRRARDYSWQLGPDRQHYILWRKADRTIEVWDLSKETAAHTLKFDRYVWGATLNEGATHFVTYSVSRQGEDDPIAHLWDVNKEEPIREFKAHWYNRNRVQSDGAISRNGRFCLENSCGGADSAPFITTLTLWDTFQSPPQRRSSITIDDSDPLHVSHLHFGDETARLVASCGLTKREYVCDISQKEPLHVYKGYGSDKSLLLAVNEDVTKFLSWHPRDRGGSFQLRTISRKEPLRVISTKQSIAGAEFSQDGLRFIAWNDRRTVSLWDAQEGKLMRTFRSDPDVRGCTFNQDETRIVSWNASNTVQLWDTDRGTLLDRFTHTNPVRGAAFHPSETLVVAWDAGGDIRVWKPGSSKPIASFHHANPLPYVDSKQVSFDREGKRVISTDTSESELMLWPIPELTK